MNDSTVKLAYQFQDIINEILIFHDYRIVNNDNSMMYNKNHDIDIVAEINNTKYIIECKYFRTTRITESLISKVSDRLNDYITNSEYNPSSSSKILVISNVLDKQFKAKLVERNNMHIIDMPNLLYMVKDNDVLRTKLLSVIEFSTQEIIIERPNIPLVETKSKNTEINYSNLITDLQRIKCGNLQSVNYERTCTQILKYLFEEDLLLWSNQAISNDGLYRFDLICKVKNGNTSDFFNTIKSFFNSKYVVFEYKNYKDYITQKEIYTTEKYLYSKALRSVAIIISRKGVDENGLKAIKGSIRENGKLIISLNDEDLFSMVNMKNNNNIPSDYLSEKLDVLLLELEK